MCPLLSPAGSEGDLSSDRILGRKLPNVLTSSRVSPCCLQVGYAIPRLSWSSETPGHLPPFPPIADFSLALRNGAPQPSASPATLHTLFSPGTASSQSPPGLSTQRRSSQLPKHGPLGGRCFHGRLWGCKSLVSVSAGAMA